MPGTTVLAAGRAPRGSAAESRGLVYAALEAAGADEAVARLESRAESSARFANNEITQNIVGRQKTLAVRATFGRRSGQASTNDLSESGVRDVAARACSLAKASPDDPEHVPLAPPAPYPEVRAWADRTASCPPLEKAQAIARAIAVARRERLTLAGSHHTTSCQTVLATSAGAFGTHRMTEAVYTNTAMTKDSSGWAESIATDVDAVDPAAVAEIAARKAKAAASPRAAAPGRYTVILEPAAAGEILQFLAWSLDARAADEGRSWAAGKRGKKLFPDAITIRSDPADARCPGDPFAEGGAPSPAVSWIERGTLASLATTRHWAQKTGVPWTPEPSNFLMKEGTASVDEMIRGVDRGLLVTRFWYIRHVDPMSLLLTGMTRDGLFAIEKGKISHGVHNLRFNESPLAMLERTAQIGRAARTGEYLRCWAPALRVDGFNFSSATEF